MIIRRQFQLLLLLQLGLLGSATIKGDKEIEEPKPLPPKELPINVQPHITKINDLVNDGKAGLKSRIEGATSVIGQVAAAATSAIGKGSGYIQETKNLDKGITGTHVDAESKDAKDDHPLFPHETPIRLHTDDDLKSTSDESSQGIIAPMHSFGLAFLMIIFSEIGDKTFLIAALMAMKHPRLLVFSAAFSSLIVMSILSALLGHAVPTLIPKKMTNWLAGGLFIVFGVRMMLEGLKMEKGTGSVQEEMKEVEQELSEKEAQARGRSASNASMLEEGRGNRSGKNALRRSTSSPAMSDSDDDEYDGHNKRHGSGGSGSDNGALKTISDGVQNLAGLLLSPAWVQTFVMTFLGEWGDRSQVATIAMAAGSDYWFVTIGAIFGHCLCTAGAVIGGRLLAEKISVRNVTLGGAVSFLVFGVIYAFEALYS